MHTNIQMSDFVLADLILLDGNIVTVDSKFSIAQAVAVKGERIVAVGKSNDIKVLAGKKTRIINLGGATLMPGINDSHCHISDWALTRPPFQLEIRYPIVKSIKDIVNMLLMMGGFGKLTADGLTDAFRYVGARYNFGNDWLKIAGTKLIGDGILPIKTAYMHQPYLDGTYGFLVTEGNSPEEQEETLRESLI